MLNFELHARNSIIIIFFYFILFSASQCTQGDVRVVGGSGGYEGNVQICNEGKWGWVCHTYWSTPEAQVVCRQIGYSASCLFFGKKIMYFVYHLTFRCFFTK